MGGNPWITIRIVQFERQQFALAHFTEIPPAIEFFISYRQIFMGIMMFLERRYIVLIGKLAHVN
jgi:hypothetical protein